MAKGSSISNVYNSDLKKLHIVLPQLPEQQKIANFLSLVDQKINLLQQQKTALETYKKGLLQQIFSQQLRFKPDTSTALSASGNEFPDWEVKRLGEFCTFFSGGTPKSSHKEYYTGNIPFIGSGNISDESVNQFVTEEAIQNSSAKIVEKGDLLYALYGATSGEVAISKINGAINQAVLCIRTNELKEFLYYFLFLNKQNIISKFLQGGQGNLSASIVKQIKINLPCLAEQTKIANFLSTVDKRIEIVQHQIENTQTFKKGLLQQMFI